MNTQLSTPPSAAPARLGRFSSLALAGALCSAVAFALQATPATGGPATQPAQQPPAQPAAQPATQPAPGPGSNTDTGTPTFHVGVNEVSLIFTVSDKHGHYVPNLGQNDFALLDDQKAPEKVNARHNHI